MPHEIIATDGEGIVITYTGILRDHEFREVDEALLALAASGRHFRYILADGSNLGGNQVSSLVIRESASNAREVSDMEKIATEIVFVMPKDLDYGLARMWESIFENTGEDDKVHLFRSRAEADAYIANLTG